MNNNLNLNDAIYAAVLLQMSVPEDLPEMDGTDLLGLLFQDGEDGSTELIESWLSEQDVRFNSQR